MKTPNILFLGTCHTDSVMEVMDLGGKEFFYDNQKRYNLYHESLHTTNINKKDFTDLIKKCDVIITQPISDNYRSKDYLNTNYIIENRLYKRV